MERDPDSVVRETHPDGVVKEVQPNGVVRETRLDSVIKKVDAAMTANDGGLAIRFPARSPTEGGADPPGAYQGTRESDPADRGRQQEGVPANAARDVAASVSGCPVCGNTLKYRPGQDYDAVLAKHFRFMHPKQLDLLDSWKAGEIATSTLPVTIYLSDGTIHGQVEAAVDGLLANVGLQIIERDEPVIGSWFRAMRASVKKFFRSFAVRDGALSGVHAADQRLVLAQDAAITAALLQNLGPVLQSLQPTKDAVLRAGALLIVKVDWVVNVFQLTAAQQAKLDHQPQLARSPSEIIAALDLTSQDQVDDDVLIIESTASDMNVE